MLGTIFEARDSHASLTVHEDVSTNEDTCVAFVG